MCVSLLCIMYFPDIVYLSYCARTWSLGRLHKHIFSVCVSLLCIMYFRCVVRFNKAALSASCWRSGGHDGDLTSLPSTMGHVRISHSSHHFATQASRSVDLAGWQAKMASIEIWIPWCNAHTPHYPCWCCSVVYLGQVTTMATIYQKLMNACPSTAGCRQVKANDCSTGSTSFVYNQYVCAHAHTHTHTHHMHLNKARGKVEVTQIKVKLWTILGRVRGHCKIS